MDDMDAHGPGNGRYGHAAKKLVPAFISFFLSFFLSWQLSISSIPGPCASISSIFFAASSSSPAASSLDWSENFNLRKAVFCLNYCSHKSQRGIMEKLIPKHGGYRFLKTFQLARLIFDITVRFCDKFVSSKSRTHDQMIQAARSGVQNIAEGSQASGTSKKTEIKLTNVARASLEELKLDYEDFLRQNSFLVWDYLDPCRQELIKCRFNTADQFAMWVRKLSQNRKEKIEEIAANGVLVLISVACTLLDRQLSAQAEAFQKKGGFTERLYHSRICARNNSK